MDKLMAHILVVDDEPMIAELLQMILEADGYEVTVANDGIEALRAEQRVSVDAVITDLTMPGLGGRELLARLREHRPGLPAIVTTGYAGVEPFEGGPTVVMTKPFNLPALSEKLAALLKDA
jgi:two-component system OmpR family response regulator